MPVGILLEGILHPAGNPFGVGNAIPVQQPVDGKRLWFQVQLGALALGQVDLSDQLFQGGQGFLSGLLLELG